MIGGAGVRPFAPEPNYQLHQNEKGAHFKGSAPPGFAVALQ
jgi:hypothetical protein